jgi:hypothetical protein
VPLSGFVEVTVAVKVIEVNTGILALEAVSVIVG